MFGMKSSPACLIIWDFLSSKRESEYQTVTCIIRAWYSSAWCMTQCCLMYDTVEYDTVVCDRCHHFAVPRLLLRCLQVLGEYQEALRSNYCVFGNLTSIRHHCIMHPRSLYPTPDIIILGERCNVSGERVRLAGRTHCAKWKEIQWKPPGCVVVDWNCLIVVRWRVSLFPVG